jgi:hypothetical protein
MKMLPTKKGTRLTLGLAALLTMTPPASAVSLFGDPYEKAIERTATMSREGEAQELARARGLQVLDLTWEDTGRFKGSSVGPNISDMTIQVGRETKGGFKTTCMPVIRFPNFDDKSCDIDPAAFTLLVGNERGRGLQRVSLRDFLSSPLDFLSQPGSWKNDGRARSLLAARDSKVLVSAQACFLPIPKEGKATFNPVLFNYQSISGDPAVLTILCTREGTSVTVIDNKRDAFASGSAWGQRLFFNANGQRASLTGERESDSEVGKEAGPEGQTPKLGAEAGLNMVLLIQVPLKQKERPRRSSLGAVDEAMPAAPAGAARTRTSDVENAVIGHGEMEGPFTEIDNLSIRRDPDYPVRVTVQFYKATSNGVVSEADVAAIKAQIDRVYAQSSYVGSLVTGGETGRVTEYAGVKVQPEGWWEEFWARHEKNTGDDRKTAIAKLKKLLGEDYLLKPVSELYVRDMLRTK